MKNSPLARVLLGSDVAAEAAAELEVAIEAALRSASEVWPEIRVDVAAFVDHWARKLAHSPNVIEAMRRTHVADLYLAFACGCGDRKALHAFERQRLSHVGSHVASIDSNAAFVDEVKQLLRTAFLLGND